MIVIINGAPGSGKSQTAKILFEQTGNSAWIEGDHLLATNPHDHGEQRHLRYKNIAALAKNYHDGGFKNIFISFVYGRTEDLSEQHNLLRGIDTVKVVTLIPNNQTLKKRHKEDSYKRATIEESVELNNKIAELQNIEIVDNSDISIEEVVKQIKQKVNII